MSRARGGDKEAFARLYSLHAEEVFRFCRARLSGDVDDLVQEVFARAWKELARFRGTAALETWLLSIAANLIADRRRRERRIAFEPLHAHIDLPSSETAEESAIRLADRERLGQDLRLAFEKLPPGARELTWARLGEGKTLPEVATAHGRTVAATRNEIWRATKRLRATLSRAGWGFGCVIPWLRRERLRVAVSAQRFQLLAESAMQGLVLVVVSAAVVFAPTVDDGRALPTELVRVSRTEQPAVIGAAPKQRPGLETPGKAGTGSVSHDTDALALSIDRRDDALTPKDVRLRAELWLGSTQVAGYEGNSSCEEEHRVALDVEAIRASC